MSLSLEQTVGSFLEKVIKKYVDKPDTDHVVFQALMSNEEGLCTVHWQLRIDRIEPVKTN